MQTKTYFATSVPAALEVARQELGQDALLVGSRPAPAAARQYGRLEVTFAFDPKRDPLRGLPKWVCFFKPLIRRKPPVSAMDEIRQELSALRVAVGGAGAQVPAKENNVIERQLVERGFSAQTASEIAAAAGRQTRRPERRRPERTDPQDSERPRDRSEIARVHRTSGTRQDNVT